MGGLYVAKTKRMLPSVLLLVVAEYTGWKYWARFAAVCKMWNRSVAPLCRSVTVVDGPHGTATPLVALLPRLLEAHVVVLRDCKLPPGKLPQSDYEERCLVGQMYCYAVVQTLPHCLQLTSLTLKMRMVDPRSPIPPLLTTMLGDPRCMLQRCSIHIHLPLIQRNRGRWEALCGAVTRPAGLRCVSFLFGCESDRFICDLFDFAWRGGRWTSFTYYLLHRTELMVEALARQTAAVGRMEGGALRRIKMTFASMKRSIPCVFDIMDRLCDLRILHLAFVQCNMSSPWWDAVAAAPFCTAPTALRVLRLSVTRCYMTVPCLAWLLQRLRRSGFNTSVHRMVLRLPHNALDTSLWRILADELFLWGSLQSCEVDVTQNRCGSPPMNLVFPWTLRFTEASTHDTVIAPASTP
jgi:hypothetical protein